MLRRTFLKSVCVLYVVFIITNLVSCSSKIYSDNIACSYITATAKETVLPTEEYIEYSKEEISLLFDNLELFDSFSVIYSSSADNVGEFGIFHASSLENTEALFQSVSEYVAELKNEKNAFVRNYLPYEISKLDSAQVKIIGNYVAFTVLDSPVAQAVFNEIESILTQ